MQSQAGFTRVALVLVIAIVAGLAFWLFGGNEGESLKQTATIKAAEVVGQMAKKNMSSASDGLDGSHGTSAELINREIEVRQIADNVHMAVGVGNVMMITTDEGNVLFDTGFIIQAAEQRKLLREQVSEGPVTHVIISHSHWDHSSGAKVYLEKDTEIITHREYTEEQRYLFDLSEFQHRRNRTFFPWLPEDAPEFGPLDWSDLEPTIIVDEGSDYSFEQGGIRFEVISAPGAEGADNIVLWLPDQKILFSGDFFGPQFPQFPNIVSLRGEKIRKPIEYIRSLNKVIALEPEMIVPSHFNPTSGSEEIMDGLVKMRDAVQYVHDQTVEYMNAGKTVYEAMREISLPTSLSLPENHGRVSWGVKMIWEYYGTWFHMDTTTELYPVPARDVYDDVSQLAGRDALLARAGEYLAAEKPVRALHLIEMALGSGQGFAPALEMRVSALETLKAQAEAGARNDYEIYWLNNRIAETNRQLNVAVDRAD